MRMLVALYLVSREVRCMRRRGTAICLMNRGDFIVIQGLPVQGPCHVKIRERLRFSS